MSNEIVLNDLKKLLADKDRQIGNLTALVAQQSDALSNYFKTRCHECNEEMDRTEIICAECHDPEPCVRDYKLHTQPLVPSLPSIPHITVPDFELKRMPDGYFKDIGHNLCLRPDTNPAQPRFIALGYYVGDVIQPLTPELQKYCASMGIIYRPLKSYAILPAPEKADSSPIKVEDLKPLESPYLPSVTSGVPKLFTPKAVPELPKSTVREKLMLRRGPFGYLRDNKHNLCIKYVNDSPIVIGYYDAEDNIKPLTIELLKYCTENKLPYEPLLPEKIEEKKEEKKVRPVEPHKEETFHHPSHVVVLKMTDGNYMARDFRFAITADGGWASRNVFGCYDEDYVIRPLTSVEIAVCTKLGFTPILTMPPSQMVDL